MKPKLLITGANGFLGWNLVRYAKSNWDVYGTTNKTQNPQSGMTNIACNIVDKGSLDKVFHEVKPNAVVHLAAASSPNDCQLQPEKTRLINIDASAKIASICSMTEIPLVFASSSQVYAGTNAPYTETSPTKPVNDYGRQKLEAEHIIRALYPFATICRVPLMFGPAPPSTSSSLQLVLKALNQGKEISLFVDEWRSSLGALSASKGLCHMLHHPGELFVLAGDETLSRYEFGYRVATFFELDASLIKPAHQADIIMAAQRPSDLTMCNDKAKTFGFHPESIDEELQYASQMIKIMQKNK